MTAVFDRMQYLTCTVLGYSLAEYRCMTLPEIERQSRVHVQAVGRENGAGSNIDEDGVEF